MARTKLLIIAVIIALLSCGPKEIRQDRPKILTPDLAKTVNWRTQTVKFKDTDGQENWVFIDGWDENGFILNRPSHPYTVPYEDLQNTLELETNISNVDKGVKLGLLYGAAGVAVLSVLAVADNDKNEGDMAGMRKFAYLYAGIAWTMLTVTVGLVLGSGSHKYIKFHYNAEDFRSDPWTMGNPGEDTSSVNILP